MTDLRARCVNVLPVTLTLLKELAAYESPSPDKAAVDTCSAYVAMRLRELGAEVAVVPQAVAGNHLAALWPGTDRSSQFLTLCHLRHGLAGRGRWQPCRCTKRMAGSSGRGSTI
jgi:acetylornithine deacetylase/succinyl-diaminopimelate desuccinylase-like protein